MGIRKDYLRGAAFAFEQLKIVYFHDLVLVKKRIPYRMLNLTVQMTPLDFDNAGVRVNADDDHFDFLPDGEGVDLVTCTEVVEQWKLDAFGAIEAKEKTVVELARRSGLSRQSLYRVINGKLDGLGYLWALRGHDPILTWKGTRLAEAYRLAKDDFQFRGMKGLA